MDAATDPENVSSHRIAIIGAGSVGAAVAYALLLHPVAGTLLIADREDKLRRAQVQDLSDAAFFGGVEIKEATNQEAGKADVIVITAGAKQRPGESRLDLVDRNIEILRSIIADMRPINPNAILLIVANPVDILTHFAQVISALPKTQVIGSGTFLDSVRLKGMLAKTISVSDRSVQAFALGEHGDGQFVAWSAASISGIPLSDLGFADSINRNAIAEATKYKAYEIIEAKGATAFGIGAAVAALCKIILFNLKIVQPVSYWHEDLKCCLSLPAVIGRRGILKTINMPLNDEEQVLLKASAKDLREVIGRYDANKLPGSASS